MFFFSLFVVGISFIFTRAMGGSSVSGLGFVGMSLIVAGIMNFFSYFYSDKMVLAISQAKEIQKKNNLQLFRSVENLCIVAGLPTPKIYVIKDSAPNAFATGRNPKHATIAFTTGILEKLNKQELEGVIAHELSHVRNRDILLSSVVSILVGLVALLADWFLRINYYSKNSDEEDNRSNTLFIVLALIAALLAPLIATLIQLAISRRREYLADASGAYLTRDPEQLAYALEKISEDREPLEVANRATAHLYIANPLKGSEAVGMFANLFNTHPPVKDRIKALMDMEV